MTPVGSQLFDSDDGDSLEERSESPPGSRREQVLAPGRSCKVGSVSSVHAPQQAVGGNSYSHHLGPHEPCCSLGLSWSTLRTMYSKLRKPTWAVRDRHPTVGGIDGGTGIRAHGPSADDQSRPHGLRLFEQPTSPNHHGRYVSDGSFEHSTKQDASRKSWIGKTGVLTLAGFGIRVRTHRGHLESRTAWALSAAKSSSPASGTASGVSYSLAMTGSCHFQHCDGCKIKMLHFDARKEWQGTLCHRPGRFIRRKIRRAKLLRSAMEWGLKSAGDLLRPNYKVRKSVAGTSKSPGHR